MDQTVVTSWIQILCLAYLMLPVMDLEPLMGAGGHSVIISTDIQEFLHVHPTEEVEPNWKGGPHISFRTSFPKPGLYKAWGQFQHKGKIIMADFVLEVV